MHFHGLIVLPPQCQFLCRFSDERWASLTVKAEREVRSHPGLIFHVTGEEMEAQRGEAPSWMSQGQQNGLSLSSFSVLPAVHWQPTPRSLI